MIIQQAAVAMSTSSTYKEEMVTRERIQLWGSVGNPTLMETKLQLPMDVVVLSGEGQAKYQELKTASVDETAELTTEDKVKISIVEMVIQAISGRKIKLKLPRLSNPNQGEPLAAPNNGGRILNRSGWGMSWEQETIYQEQATMSFQAQGQVLTQDGRAISFDLQLNLERSYWSRESIRVNVGQKAIDPLVINFDAASARTGSTRFSFDLNSDGVNEDIATLQRGSGFLALDLNGDNLINNGKELFGPQSGDGFTDLAAYDDDGNGWIDENDLIFNRLLIWTVDDSGQQQLFSLQDKNIGAIFLGQTASSFALKDAGNQELAQIKSSGVFLREDGTAGTVQDLDMIV